MVKVRKVKAFSDSVKVKCTVGWLTNNGTFHWFHHVEGGDHVVV